MIAPGLGEISPGNNAEPRTKRLQQNRHQIRKQNDAEQHVAKLGTAGEVGRPISRIHVTDGDEITRAGEREQLSPKACVARDRDSAMHFRQTWPRPLGPPSARNLLLHLLSVLKIRSRASGKRLALDVAGACSFVNLIIFAPAFFRIFRLPQNRTDRSDQDSSGCSANVCTSKATAPALRARLAQMNPSKPARFRGGLHSAPGQSANEKQPGNVLAAMARNGPE